MTNLTFKLNQFEMALRGGLGSGSYSMKVRQWDVTTLTLLQEKVKNGECLDEAQGILNEMGRKYERTARLHR